MASSGWGQGVAPWDLVAVGLLVAAITFAVLELLLVFDLVVGHLRDESYTFRKAEAAWASGDHESETESERPVP